MQTQVPPGSYAGPQGRPAEPKAEKYLRHIRNILGWILALWLIGGAITGIVLIHDASSQSSSTSSSNCLSQGGTDTSC